MQLHDKEQQIQDYNQQMRYKDQQIRDKNQQIQDSVQRLQHVQQQVFPPVVHYVDVGYCLQMILLGTVYYVYLLSVRWVETVHVFHGLV